MCAGIRLVIAENIERIYKQNCQNLGLLTSTNFSLIEKVRAGEEIPLAEFTAGEDEITRQVIEYGGLFPFNVARLQKKVFLPPIKTAKRPMTVAEKIFARHMLGPECGRGRPRPSGGAKLRSGFRRRRQTRRHRLRPRRPALQPRIRHADGGNFLRALRRQRRQGQRSLKHLCFFAIT